MFQLRLSVLPCREEKRRPRQHTRFRQCCCCRASALQAMASASEAIRTQISVGDEEVKLKAAKRRDCNTWTPSKARHRS